MTQQHAPDHVAEVAQQMEAVRHLDRLRRAPARAVGVLPAPVAADDRDLRVLPQPRRDSRRRPIGQEVDESVPLQIDQHRPVAPPLAPGEIVHAADADRRGRWRGRAADQAQQGVRARRLAEIGGEARPRLATEREGDRFQRAARPRRPPRIGRREVAQALGEDPPRAAGGGAAKPPDGHAEAGAATGPRHVLERAHVLALHTRRQVPAVGAAGSIPGQAGAHHDRIARLGDRLHAERQR